jgi:hypothetical protein
MKVPTHLAAPRGLPGRGAVEYHWNPSPTAEPLTITWSQP